MGELFLHIHLLAAIAWIGGSIFMFVLGVSLRDKRKQEQVYPNIGPIFGYFELITLIILLVSGISMIGEYGLIELLLSDEDSRIAHLLRLKLGMVFLIIIATSIHFIIAYRTNGKSRTPLEQLLSRASSMFIFIINLAILHYAIMIRSILS